MRWLRPLSLAAALCLAWPATAPRARQDADAGAGAADERAATGEERRRALADLLAAAEQYRATGQTLEAARALNRAGRLQAKLNLHLDALATHREALTLLEQTSHPPTNIDNVNGLGKAHINLSQCADAEPLLRQAISLSEQHGYTAGKAEALLALSHCQNHQDHALALRTAQEALALWRSADRPRGVAQAYAAVGEYHLAQNNLTEAAQSYEAALNLWRELRVADEQAEALIILGYIEYRGGAWQNVLAFMTQAQNLLDQEAEPYKMGQISSGLAESFIESGLPEFGLGQYLQALGHYRRSQNPRAVIVTTWGIGKTYFTLKNYEEALAHFRQALAEAEAIKELGIAAMCDDFMGRTYAAMSDPAAAMRHYEAALDSYVRAGNTMAAARVRALMGEVYEQQGRVDKAREHYRSALQTFLALSDHVNQAGTLYALGRMELRRNNLDAAEENLRRAIEVTENMRRVSTSRDLTAAFSATVHERYEKYIECLMRQQEARPARDLAVRAFETSELARARSLAELLRATQTDLAPGLDPELARREKSLRQSLRVKEDYKVALLGRPYEAGELSALEAELARLEAEYRQVAETIRARHPAYERVARPAAWDLQRIQEQVVADDETVLLEYALGADRSYVWAVTRDGMTSHELPPRALIHAAARKVYESLARPPTDAGAGEFDAAARELSGMVLSPVAAHLRKGRVIVVADGALNYIPFQVLPGPGAGDEPLVAGHEIVNAPSASILGELRQEAARRRPAARVLAAFGNPVFASNYAQLKEAGGGRLLAQQAPGLDRWQHVLRDLGLNGDTFDPSVIKPLFYAKRELAHLADVAAGGETFVAADFSATREQLLGADLTQYAIVHFATHGFLDPTRPENSGLVLSTVNRDGQAQDGFVGLQNIYELRAPVDLVVLSACQTALGKDVRGEGLLGLTRGFMYAGASSVVASLWKVDDEATAELMREFYTNMLQKGVAPAAALRAAQNSIRQKPEWRSPYYWAAFTLQGEYRRAIKPTAVAGTKALSLKLAGGAALLLLAGLAWRLRRRLMRPAATLR